MTLWTGQDLSYIFGCVLSDNLIFNGISIDSRTAEEGDLFFAIKGLYSNGHDYVHHAIERGCAAVVVDHIIPGVAPDFPQILVDNTLDALNILAQAARARSKAKIVAITGSVGKTSTKEILRHVLGAYGKTSYSLASYNNHWGVPLSLARLPQDACYAVFEVGMNNPNEIAPLSHLISPHIAIITTIAPAHIGHMGSMAAIAEEKSYLFSGLITPGGVAIIPADTPFKSYLISRARAFQAEKILTFGSNSWQELNGKSGQELCQTVDYSLLSYESTGPSYDGRIHAHLPKKELKNNTNNELWERVDYTLSIPGRHQALNSLIALAVVQSMNLPIEPALTVFSKLSALKGRGIIHKISLGFDRQITLIDDSYNANLTSIKAALDLISAIEPEQGGRRIVVLGEMMELGHEANAHHQEISDFINELPVEAAYYVGGGPVQHGFSYLSPPKQGLYVKKIEDLQPVMVDYLKNNDVLLVKGSKSTRVSLLVDHLLNLNNHGSCGFKK